jgi:chemotaxis protein methyltransferase WspC
LIYFDRLVRGQALNRIERLLAPAGVLFVSPVEQPLAIDQGFVAAKTPMAFACCKPSSAVRRQRATGITQWPAGEPGPLSKGGSHTQPQASGKLLLRPARKPAPALSTDLKAAHRLADAGRLKEAAEICEAHLRESRVSAQAYYLLGLVRDASGEAGAIDCYRKALYLEPNHYESLLQMALLLQENGEAGRARALKSRAQRIRMQM